MKKNQKGNVLLVVVIVLLVLFVFWWLMQKGYKLPGYPKQTAEGPAIRGGSDLDSVSKDLDGEDMGQFDADLNQLDSETSSF